MMKHYDHKKIEKKWQAQWEKDELYKTKNSQDKKKYYCLVEFPYPSGEGLHVGHIRSYTAMDIIARKRRAEGYNTLYPIGWDAFGLPTENYAIKTGIHPKEVTKKNTDTFKKQLQSLGFSFDWDREINTTDPEYYKWTQWIFIQLFKQGLAYKGKMPINWCLSCKIGLANEEVIEGKCERCGGETEKRDREQWMLAITKYADRLDKDLDAVDYVEKIKIQQRNWIGRSEGAEIEFRIKNHELGIKVFTTRADTLFGATYLVLSPEHPLLANNELGMRNYEDVQRYIGEAKKKKDIERTVAQREKTGVELKGIKAINPANKEEIPIWVADYVLAGHGTGAIMAVPAHDERDFEFAQQMNAEETRKKRGRNAEEIKITPVILAQQEKSRSFIMGTDAITETDLQKIGAEIVEKTEKGFFKVFIPFDRLEEYKAFIREKMTHGFWNEFSTENGFYFIFKRKGGKIEEFELNERTNGIIDMYGATFNNQEPPKTPRNVYSRLARNSFYKEILVHTGKGTLVNSGEFDGMKSEEAKDEIIKFVKGEKKIIYKLRDWVFSRQRYWGEPIPIITCEKCGFVPVAEEDLPVTLPDVKNYKPTDTGESPLANIHEWVKTTCPRCGSEAKRETDVMPNWAGSSWYYIAYTMQGISNFPFDKAQGKQFPISKYQEVFKRWLPVDWYNGGMEHTTLHLLYSRFWHKFLYDSGFVPTIEPYQKRTSHGMILAEGGEKMSKSKGNVINPDEIIVHFGADALRLYEMFMGPFDQAIAWNTSNMVGVRRFLEKIWRLREKVSSQQSSVIGHQSSVISHELESLLHETIKKVGEDIEELKFNTALSAMMIFANALDKLDSVPRVCYANLLRLLAPFAPHITEELWDVLEKGKESIHLAPWPVFDITKIKKERITVIIQIDGKVRDSVEIAASLNEEEVKTQVLARLAVKKWTEGKRIRKTIYVPHKLISIVTE